MADSLYQVVTRIDSLGVGEPSVRTNYTESLDMAKRWARYDLMNYDALPEAEVSKDGLVYTSTGYTYHISVTITKIR